MATESSEADKREKSWLVAIAGWHPARLNHLMRGHWSNGHRLKRLDKNLVALSVLGAGVPRAEDRRKVELTIVLGPRMRGGDPDAYWKSLLDALVACGALKGDSKEWVEYEQPTYARSAQHATLIQITEAPAPRMYQSDYRTPRRLRIPPLAELRRNLQRPHDEEVA